MKLFEDFNRKLDNTRLRVIEGDIPAGEWIFNGHGMVFVPGKNGESEKTSKICIILDKKVKVIPTKAEESHFLHEAGANLTPLIGTYVGATFLGGLFGAMSGFALGSMVGRNEAKFSCLLDDGRSFSAIADYKIFRRIQQIART